MAEVAAVVAGVDPDDLPGEGAGLAGVLAGLALLAGSRPCAGAGAG
jgi:hypothetical protein